MRNKGFGFTEYYLRCLKESKMSVEFDIEVYAMIIELDTKLGTSGSQLLRACLVKTSRWDIIKKV